MGEPYLLFVIGATKAGTTWLHRAFYTHPECAVRRVKEVHYWDTDALADLRGILKMMLRRRDRALATGAKARARGDLDAAREPEALAGELDRVIEMLKSGRTDHTAYLEYVLHSDGPANRVLAADITPKYAALSPQTLAEMHQVRPGSRLYLLRDPLARFWSHVRMVTAWRVGGHSPTDAFQDAANRLAARVLKDGAEPLILALGDYAGVAAKLAQVVPEDRLHFFYFEDMMTQPGFDQLCDTLGIARRPANLEKRVHVSAAAPMEGALVARALEQLGPQYDWALRRFGALPAAWRSASQVVAT